MNQRASATWVITILAIAIFGYASLTGDENTVGVDDEVDKARDKPAPSGPLADRTESRERHPSASTGPRESAPGEVVSMRPETESTLPLEQWASSAKPSAIEKNRLDTTLPAARQDREPGLPSLDASENSDSSGPEDEESSERFEKLGALGSKLKREATNWDCVVDNTTELVWEVKSAEAGLHYRGNKFSWYYPALSQSGVFPGKPSPAEAMCSQSEAGNGGKESDATPCNTQNFSAKVNQTLLCGYSDWRVPSVSELESIVDSNRKTPAIDTFYFPSTQNGYYWTTSSYAYDDRSSWAISFMGGAKNDQKKKLGHYVRLVRGVGNTQD